MQWLSSSDERRQFWQAIIAPVIAQASSATMYSGRFSEMIATRSRFAMPRLVKTLASRRTASSSVP